VLIFTGLRQDLTHLAHKENTQSEIFSVRQAKNFNCILFSYSSDIRYHLTWLKYWPYKVLISSGKILAHFPNTLKEVKLRKKNPFFILDTMIWSKKPSHTPFPLRMVSCNSPFAQLEEYVDALGLSQPAYSVLEFQRTSALKCCAFSRRDPVHQIRHSKSSVFFCEQTLYMYFCISILLV
jgi:hypothetical protein